jgi:hypothetical protein
MSNRCLFCGGDARTPDHLQFCDGRQGSVEARTFDPADACRTPEDEDLPMLISGIEPATWDTSASAAASVEDERDTQRGVVFDAIRAAGADGRTDDELQALLELDGSSERPRRWELWKLDRIRIKRDDDGHPIRRCTRTNRRAVVWIAN